MMERIKKNSRYVAILITLYCFSIILFFAPVFINLNIIKGVSFSIIIIYFIAVIPEIFFEKDQYSRYSGPVRNIVLVALLTVVNSYSLHDQGLLLSVRSMLVLLPFSFFYFLTKCRVTIHELENIITNITILYIILFFVALTFAPLIIFDANGKSEEIGINMSRGVARVKLLGVCFVYLSLFISINRWNLRRKWFDIVYIGFLYVVVFLNVSRQHIVFALILGILMFIQKVKLPVKILIISLSIGIINYILEKISFVKNIVELSVNQLNDEGGENVRLHAFNYFFLDYNHSMYAILFGNGIPNLNSKWGNKFEYLAQTMGYVTSDVGYAKLFIYTGLLGLIIFAYLIIKMFKQKIPPTILYCKYYLAFLVLTNIVSHSFFTDTITFVLIIYILDHSYRNSFYRQG